jgi:hypothetical protein
MPNLSFSVTSIGLLSLQVVLTLEPQRHDFWYNDTRHFDIPQNDYHKNDFRHDGIQQSGTAY